MVAAQDAAAAAFTPPSPAEPLDQVVDERAALTAQAIARVRQLESQLIEDEPVVPAPRVSSHW
jgi:hypothetical protein